MAKTYRLNYNMSTAAQNLLEVDFSSEERGSSCPDRLRGVRMFPDLNNIPYYACYVSMAQEQIAAGLNVQAQLDLKAM